MKKIFALLFCITAFIFAVVIFGRPSFPKPVKSPQNFEDCVKMGYPIIESYPKGCRTPKGEIFFEIIEEKL